MGLALPAIVATTVASRGLRPASPAGTASTRGGADRRPSGSRRASVSTATRRPVARPSSVVPSVARVAVVLIIGTGFGAGVWYEGRRPGSRGRGRGRGRLASLAGALGRAAVGSTGLSAPAESVASGPGILAARPRARPGSVPGPTPGVSSALPVRDDPIARPAVARGRARRRLGRRQRHQRRGSRGRGMERRGRRAG